MLSGLDRDPAERPCGITNAEPPLESNKVEIAAIENFMVLCDVNYADMMII